MLLLDANIKIFRLTQVSGNRTAYLTFTTSIESTTQPLGAEKAAFYDNAHGKMFRIFLDSSQDVREGDQIRDYEGNIYEIIAGGVDRRNDGFIADYLGVTVKKIN